MYRWSTPGCEGNRMKIQGISVTRHLLPSYWTTLTPKHTGDLFKVASTLIFLGCNPIHSLCFPFPTHIWYASSTSLSFFFFFFLFFLVLLSYDLDLRFSALFPWIFFFPFVIFLLLFQDR